MPAYFNSTYMPFPSQSVPASSFRFVLTDLNGDSKTDILVLSTADQQSPGLRTPVLAYLNDGSGVFTENTASVFGSNIPTTDVPRAVAVADFNGDGRPDIFIADHGYDASPFPGGQNTLLLSTATGMVGATANLPTLLDFSHSTASADINGDGTADLLVMNIYGGTPPTGPQTEPYFLLGDGAGHFTRNDTRLPADVLARSVQEKFTATAFLDANGDGKPDLFLGSSDESASSSSMILLNDGTGHFTTEIPTPRAPAGVNSPVVVAMVADINNDGRPDLVTSIAADNYSSGRIQILINSGNGNFIDQTSNYFSDPTTPQWISNIQYIDVNGDGLPDIVLSRGTTAPIYLNDGAGHFINMPASYLSGQVDSPFQNVFVADLNGDSRADIVVDLEKSMRVLLQAAAPAVQVGTDAADALVAGAGGASLQGLGGNDTLFGGAGADSVSGGDGNDYLVGGSGADTLDGGAGDNTQLGGGGDDYLIASSSAGHNYLRGGDGNDSISGGSGYNDVNGNKGDDTIVGHSQVGDWLLGGQGNDSIDATGATGHNILNGNIGNDTVSGGDYGDTLRGGQGDDVIHGGSGNDLIYGDLGNNTITGGAGADTFHNGNGVARDIITDFHQSEGDRVQISASLTYTVSQVSGDVHIDVSNGDVIVLQNTQLSVLNAGWIFGG